MVQLRTAVVLNFFLSHLLILTTSINLKAKSEFVLPLIGPLMQGLWD